jgi:hypothetical protein
MRRVNETTVWPAMVVHGQAESDFEGYRLKICRGVGVQVSSGPAASMRGVIQTNWITARSDSGEFIINGKGEIFQTLTNGQAGLTKSSADNTSRGGYMKYAIFSCGTTLGERDEWFSDSYSMLPSSSRFL